MRYNEKQLKELDMSKKMFDIVLRENGYKPDQTYDVWKELDNDMRIEMIKRTNLVMDIAIPAAERFFEIYPDLQDDKMEMMARPKGQSDDKLL